MYPLKAQTLWYNSNIRVNNKIVCWHDAYKKGLLWVSQIIDQNNKLIDYAVAQDNFGLNFIQLLSLYHAYINAVDFEYLNDAPSGLDISYYEVCLQKRSLSQFVYLGLINNCGMLENKAAKWTEELEILITEESLYQVINCIYKSTNVSKYRDFQYRLLHRAIITNVHLKHWKMRDDNLCSFCNTQKETYSHLFATCPEVKNFWVQVKDLMLIQMSDTESVLSFEPKDIICNSVCDDSRHLYNFLCLVVKQYIYRQRCFKSDLNIVQLKREICNIKNMEKYIATKNRKLHRFLQ